MTENATEIQKPEYRERLKGNVSIAVRGNRMSVTNYNRRRLDDAEASRIINQVLQEAKENNEKEN